MRLNFLNLLECPVCGAKVLGVTATESEAAEIRTGVIQCPTCSLSLAIKDGIVDALYAVSETVHAEIVGSSEMARRERANADDEWLLSLPASYGRFYRAKDEAWQNEEAEVKALIELVSPRPGQVVLDIGAGTTWSTNELARRGCCAVAVDVSQEKFVGLSSSETFMAHYGTYYERLAADMSSRVPFRSGAFDVVFAFSALHHAPDLRVTFREIARVLKPEGKLAFIEATAGFLEAPDAFGSHEKAEFGLNEHKHSLRVYRRLAEAAGFTLEIFMAPSFRAKLDGFRRGTLRPPGPIHFKHRLGRALAKTVWGIPGVPALAARSYPMICRVFGAQILAVATKQP